MSETLDLAQLGVQVLPCPLCQGTDFSPLARHDRHLLGLTTVGCLTCGLVQVNPRPNAEGLSDFYTNYYRTYYQGTVSPDRAYITRLAKDTRLAYTADYFRRSLRLSDNATILDFGCGEGSLFAALRNAGFTGAFYGVELNAKFGEFASTYGNATVSNSIRCRELVDLVVVNHVLEHLPDPVGTLVELGKLLKPDGHLYIDVPDVEAYQSIQDLHIAHILHFSRRTLSAVVARAGFQIDDVEQHAPPNHPRSIRLTGRRTAATLMSAVPDATLEAESWQAVRRSGRFKNTLRLRLRKVGVFRRVYRIARRSLGLMASD